MTTELRRLKVKYWLRRNCTVGQLQIARATVDHGHTGQSEIKHSDVSEKSNYFMLGEAISAMKTATHIDVVHRRGAILLLPPQRRDKAQ